MSLVTGSYNFWHTYGSDIQNGAVVVSAIAAFAIIRDARSTARRRGTMDLILHQESDAELVEARDAFNVLKNGVIKISSFGTTENRNSKEAVNLRKVLNIHELTAVAIQEGVIDECVYRRWFNATYIADYDATKDYITAVRSNFSKPAAYKEFEETAIRWRGDVSWYTKPSWWSRKVKALKSLTKA